MEKLEKNIGYVFSDKNLLKLALTHSSYANEMGGNYDCNERLEFLGDSVLSIIVSDYLFNHYENAEGDLTKLREMKIKRANPAEIAKLEKDMKKQQKMSASLGVTANRISEDLKYVQTPAYLNAMIRKMSHEQAENREEK